MYQATTPSAGQISIVLLSQASREFTSDMHQGTIWPRPNPGSIILSSAVTECQRPKWNSSFLWQTDADTAHDLKVT